MRNRFVPLASDKKEAGIIASLYADFATERYSLNAYERMWLLRLAKATMLSKSAYHCLPIPKRLIELGLARSAADKARLTVPQCIHIHKLSQS